ncbi:MAG: HAD family hydrolase [Halofilum sp. (in: g-proteobacteria)]
MAPKSPSDREIAGIVFDKDGTLVDFAATWVPVNREAARRAARYDDALARRLLEVGGFDLATDRIAGGSLLAAANTREIAAAWIDAGAPYALDELTQEMDAVFAAGAARSVAVTDLVALFERLRARGIRIAVVTSDSEAAARATLASVGLAAEGLFVVGYDSGFTPKPSPAAVHGFCETHGLTPDQVAVVGDNLHDIRMGSSAGCALSVGVLTGTGTAVELASEADRVLDSIADLETLLNERVTTAAVS